ncbi:glycerate kinase [Microbacterium sp. BK668]|uniref:glycerate kinase n=1 Tax=Microbacterium sp. BK668 TaxID=2512118 RepID=UPI00105DEBE9|nr:glycerate kinase [Microbacterium sp. BK668]TDN90793.1 glycerate kinase [Microbacterium sp. BK668]
MSSDPALVVIAMDSFKGSITAADAVTAVREGWLAIRRADDVRLLPMADGGEGTLDAFEASVPGAVRQYLTVTGPDDRPVESSWLLLPPTTDAPAGVAVVELASTSGIEMLGSPPTLRPLDAHTRGFGEAIADALGRGVSRLVLGIGSSASTDGGAGMLSALGARLRDRDGRPVPPGNRGLHRVRSADLSGMPPLPPLGVTVLSDVGNPLLGSRGAAAVFGPQKGATVADIAFLERGLARLAEVLPGDPRTAGAGAAGGTGFALLAWGARLTSGAMSVARLVGLPAAVAAASVVITGEGSFDGQSAEGKVPLYVAGLAASARVPVSLIAGRISTDAPVEAFASCVSLTEVAGSSAASMADPRRWLVAAGRRLAGAI